MKPPRPGQLTRLLEREGEACARARRARRDRRTHVLCCISGSIIVAAHKHPQLHKIIDAMLRAYCSKEVMQDALKLLNGENI